MYLPLFCYYLVISKQTFVAFSKCINFNVAIMAIGHQLNSIFKQSLNVKILWEGKVNGKRGHRNWKSQYDPVSIFFYFLFIIIKLYQRLEKILKGNLFFSKYIIQFMENRLNMNFCVCVGIYCIVASRSMSRLVTPQVTT